MVEQEKKGMRVEVSRTEDILFCESRVCLVSQEFGVAQVASLLEIRFQSPHFGFWTDKPL